MKSWINTEREYKLEKFNKLSNIYRRKLLLTEDYEILETNKLGTQLLPHQQRTVKAMVDLEKKRYLKITSNDRFEKIIIETSAAILSEKPGSGKTYEILAVIAENIILPNIAEITSLPFPKNKIIKTKLFADRDDFKNIGFGIEVRKTYKKIFRQTLIFVGKSVLAQWSERIKKYTKFNVFIIENIFDLRKFYNMIFVEKDFNKFNTYDIILIKNGNIAGEFNKPELISTSLEFTKSKPILNIFGELFINCCWNRVVLDDFDTLSIPTNAKVIPSKFTWFVSATKKFPVTKKITYESQDIDGILENYRSYYINIWSNKELFAFFNIGCADSFIDTSTKASLIKYYLYNIPNENDKIINLIDELDDNKSIAEMINSDSIGTAAKEIGIKTNSVIEIFEKILDKKWDVYKKNIAIEKYLIKVNEKYSDLPITYENKISAENFNKLKKNLKTPGPFSFINKIQFQQTNITDLLKEIEITNQAEKNENSKALDRVKNNLKDNECPITCELLSESAGILITKCCGIAISKEGVDLIFTQPKINCVKCRTLITKNQIIYIDRKISIDKILEPEFEDLEKEEEEENKIENKEKEENKIEFDELDLDIGLEPEMDDTKINKINCIIKIIQNKDIPYKELRNDILIPGLLEGPNDYGDAIASEKKVIIFTNYKESMKLIEDQLVKKGISFAKLNGTARQIAEIHNNYLLDNNHIRAINVLLIDGPKFCAGLDLQNTTDLIFAHNVIDTNIKIQIAGRGARYARKKNFHIHYVLYNNEIK